ncbi:hypothetical protein [Streptomyces sp. NPDC093589]|uniref:hypothetical protein n=1 Tax=Streptomyces sp. NPDC093589 TaxID=3366043 RepID=UPI003810428F
MIPEHELPDDIGESIHRLVASEPAYYAHKDQLYAGYQDAIANNRTPSAEERHEARRRRVTADAQVVSAARRIVQREKRRWMREQGADE